MQTILTSREFNQDASGAKRAAKHGPVFITDRGKPAHVLLSIEEYQRLTGGPGSIIDLLLHDRFCRGTATQPPLNDNFLS